MPTKPRNRAYKELTLHQLRSLCETARLGSFASAAEALGLSHPTVLQQVHALERDFGVPLVETHGRGCDLTPAGRLLVELAGPTVEAVASLKARFSGALADLGGRLAVAITPRLLVEDLAPCVVAFRAESPSTRFDFVEMDDEEVLTAVESRRADLGFTPALPAEAHRTALTCDPVYALEVRLICPAGHPLARKKKLEPKDLRGHPLVNPPDARAVGIRSVLQQAGITADDDYAVRANFTTSIRRFVALGGGIGLVLARSTAPPQPGLAERSLGSFAGDIPIHAVRRRGSGLAPHAEQFIRLVRRELGAAPPAASG